MLITAVFQKTRRGWGKRIAEHIAENHPDHWEVNLNTVPSSLPVVIDQPEPFIPGNIISCDLLLLLAEGQGLAQLIPDFAEAADAEAVLAPVDSEKWFPKGLQNQMRDRLKRKGRAVNFPRPFCSFCSGEQEHWSLKKFASEFGRPEYEFCIESGSVKEVRVKCSTPCGSSTYIASELKGVNTEHAGKKGALLHQYYPCLASVDIIHSSAYITQEAVKRALG